MEDDEDDEEEEDVGSKLGRIRAAQASCGQDSDEDSSSCDAVHGVLVVPPEMSQVHALSQQGFSQELSQASSQLYCQQPSPAVLTNVRYY
jgi:hypothetical protein